MALLSTPTVMWPAPTGLTGRFFGNYSASPTVYYYWVQAVYIGGTSPLSASTGAVNTSSIDKNNFVELNWSPMVGAFAYNIFRTTTSTAPTAGTTWLTVTSAANFIDNGIFTPTASTIARNGVFTARMFYDFTVDGGAIGAITPVQSDTIPAGAIVVNGYINSTVAATSGGAATISIGTTAGSSAASLKAATGVGSFTLDAVQVTLAPTAPFKMTAAGQLNLTVAAATLTAGTIEVQVQYMFPVNL